VIPPNLPPHSHDLRRNSPAVSRLLHPEARPHIRPVVPGGSPGRSHAPLRQRGDESVQADIPRPGKTHLHRAPPNTQKCIRAGGKHTISTMSADPAATEPSSKCSATGASAIISSAGAIEMAWELLTQVLKLDPSRLHVTCYEGDEKNGIPARHRSRRSVEENREICRRTTSTISARTISGKWATRGPCGPCSEIYSRVATPDKPAAPQVKRRRSARHGVPGTWSSSSTTANADRTLTPLPARHVDTGMGFRGESARSLQDKSDIVTAIDLLDAVF